MNFREIKNKLRIKIEDKNNECATDRWANIGKEIFKKSEMGLISIKDIKNSIFNEYIFEVPEVSDDGKTINYNYINIDEKNNNIHLESSIYIKYNKQLLGTHIVLLSVDLTFEEALELIKDNKRIKSNENNFKTGNEKILSTMKEEEKRIEQINQVMNIIFSSSENKRMENYGEVSNMINTTIKYAIALHTHINLLQSESEEKKVKSTKDKININYTPIPSRTPYRKDYKNLETMLRMKRTVDYDMLQLYMSTKRTYNKIKEIWLVRGHYRHYKSGKTIFVKSYEKGNKEHTLQLEHYII